MINNEKRAMPRISQHPKAERFNFRIDPALKAAFTEAIEAKDKPAAQILCDFMRAFFDRRNRKTFQAEARWQSLAASARPRDQQSDAKLCWRSRELNRFISRLGFALTINQ
jgi:hypothetical protein